MKVIHQDNKTAIEICLLFLSNLANAYYNGNEHNWKRLNAKKLRAQLRIGRDQTIYKRVIELLSSADLTENGPMIEMDGGFVQGIKSSGYKLTEKYNSKGVRQYHLKTEIVRFMRKRSVVTFREEVAKNEIVQNLNQFYKNIELPSIEEIIAEGRKLSKEGYRTKKGKLLTMRNKNGLHRWKNPQDRVFIEDHIRMYKRLTKDGFILPMPSEGAAGGRVIDSLNLMPSWIRKMIKIDGQRLEEIDFKALHPNIAIAIYGGTSSFLTHDQVAEETGLSKDKVKKLHLSFFNHEIENVYHSPLFAYYQEKEPEMLSLMLRDKAANGYTATTTRMFQKEVEIMTKVIRKLNSEGIYVGYVFDALICKPEHRGYVKQVMNSEVYKCGVRTIAE